MHEGRATAWARLAQVFALARRRIGWSEIVVLAAIALCAGGLLVFAEVVDEVQDGEARAFDRAVLLALHDAGGRPAWLDAMFVDLTTLGGYTVITVIVLLSAGYLAITRRWTSVAFVLVTIPGGALLSDLLKQEFERPRPDLVPHLVEVQTASLPSGHALVSAVAYLTLGALVARVQPRRRLKLYIMAAAALITLAVGVSRVYLGVHWPTDVIAGWALGAAWAMACWLGARGVGRWRARR